jgi:hypothetical protein
MGIHTQLVQIHSKGVDYGHVQSKADIERNTDKKYLKLARYRCYVGLPMTSIHMISVIFLSVV